MKKTCSRGKHSAKSENLNKKKIVVLIVILVVLAILVISILEKDENIESGNINYIEEISAENEALNIEEIDVNTLNEINTTITDIVEMPDKIENYKVIGQLVIEKIEFEKYILNKTTDYSLNLSVTKLYGPKANGQGNLCIIGHNSKGLFIKLKKLKIDDTFYIIDKENCEKVTYKIYDKYTVNPTDLDCLSQNTNDKREVTLITCNPRRVN